jgi:TonB family protein
MNVQGRIIVEFTLLTDGRLQNIKVISGHRLLRKATIKALEKALSFFPIVSQRITIKAPIDYRLR